MSRGYNYGYGFDNREYLHRDPRITYDAPQSGNVNLVFDDNRVVFEEKRPLVSSYPNYVVIEEHRVSPVHRNHRHGSMEPRKQVHFVEHDERVIESVDSFGNQKVYKESVDSEADGFINKKHKNFELNKFGTFNSYY
ncbi:hypothetical protein L1887_35279 [Cichorium endivia]|nr:hypothetical protein L1887_35279 [Cichorium endivia]